MSPVVGTKPRASQVGQSSSFAPRTQVQITVQSTGVSRYGIYSHTITCSKIDLCPQVHYIQGFQGEKWRNNHTT
jgi:hypothetical protein